MDRRKFLFTLAAAGALSERSVPPLKTKPLEKARKETSNLDESDIINIEVKIAKDELKHGKQALVHFQADSNEINRDGLEYYTKKLTEEIYKNLLEKRKILIGNNEVADQKKEMTLAELSRVLVEIDSFSRKSEYALQLNNIKE